MKYEDFGYFICNIWRRSNSLFIKVEKCLIHSRVRVRMLKHFWDIQWNGQDLGYVNIMVEGLSKGVDGCCFDFNKQNELKFSLWWLFYDIFRIRIV